MPALARLPRISEIVDDRQFARHPAFPAPDHRTESLILSDVSVFGCQIEGEPTRALTPGQFVQIDFSRNLPVKGIVRWQRGANLGVEFLLPLSPAEIAVLIGATQAVELRVL